MRTVGDTAKIFINKSYVCNVTCSKELEMRGETGGNIFVFQVLLFHFSNCPIMLLKFPKII